MLETKEQKQYFTVCLILVLILGFISFRSKPDLIYKDKVSLNKKNTEFNAQAYLKYLADLKVDPQASKQLFQTLFTEADIKKEVELSLNTSQPIVQPKVEESALKILPRGGKTENIDYLAKSTGLVLAFNTKTSVLTKNLFSEDPGSVQKVSEEYNTTYKKLTELRVPKDAKDIHLSLLSAYLSYGKFLQTAKDYAVSPQIEPWDKVYRDYFAINEQMQNYSAQLSNLAEKYRIAGLEIYPQYAEENSKQSKFVFIPTAKAIFGIGDVSITIGDIPRIIKEAIEEGLAASFSQFMGSFIQKIVNKIEKNYLIANFLYYNDALVSGQYTDDYLQKYVSNTLDRQIVKKFIPQFNCGRNENLKLLFKAKAQDYLGFNPTEVSISDKDYYTKMAKVGDFLATPEGWQNYYEGIAQEAKSEAEKAAEKELTSPGLKTPRDTIKNAISLSISGIVSTERANLNAIMQLGISNAKTFVSKFVSQLTQTLVTQFVFRGAVSVGGTVGVLKEQATCVAVAQLQPVLSVDPTSYPEPQKPPDENDILKQECAKYSDNCEQLVTPAPTPNP